MTLSATKPVFASGISNREDTASAVSAVLDSVSPRITEQPTFAAVFLTPHHLAHVEDIVNRLSRSLSPGLLIGTTAEGVIGTRYELEREPGISLIVGHLPGATLIPIGGDGETTVTETLATDAYRWRAVVLFADPFTTPLGQLPVTSNEIFPDVPLVGGVASGAQQPGGNRMILNEHIFDRGAVGFAIAGAVHVQCTVSQGCRPIGTPFIITKAKRNVVQELGGRNALEQVQAMVQEVGEEDRDLVQRRGLQVGRVINEYQSRFGRGDFIIRGISGIDQKSGAIGIGDPHIRVGQTVQFHVRDDSTAREDFQMMLDAQKLHGEAGGAMLFSCNGRGSRFFGDSNVDANLVADALGDVPLAGFFAAGELGPVGNQNFVHGHTASLLVLRGDEANGGEDEGE